MYLSHNILQAKENLTRNYPITLVVIILEANIELMMQFVPVKHR